MNEHTKVVTMNGDTKVDDEIFREVAEEEGMTEEEVREIWETFQQRVEEYRRSKDLVITSKQNKNKKKSKRKMAKKSRRKNR